MLSHPVTCPNVVPLGGVTIEGPVHSVPLAAAHARLGFPNPAEDFMDEGIDLHKLLVRHPAATYLYRADGWSMINAGICDGDILVVDRAVHPQSGDLVIAVWDGNQPSCKVLKVFEHHIELHSANPEFPPIVFEPGAEVEVFAVVGIARQIQRRNGRVRAR